MQHKIAARDTVVVVVVAFAVVGVVVVEDLASFDWVPVVVADVREIRADVVVAVVGVASAWDVVVVVDDDVVEDAAGVVEEVVPSCQGVRDDVVVVVVVDGSCNRLDRY